MATGQGIDVYTIPLQARGARLDRLSEILSPEEHTRIAKFRFAKSRRQAVVCRGTLREVLAQYVNGDPAAIRFAYNAHGKPRLPGSEVRFNLSHSGDWAMLAVSRDREVGIDIQRIDSRFAQEQMPERFFSPHETAQLRALPALLRTEAFFRCWTRKQAYIKARGLGVALALDSFDVTFGPGDPPALARAGNWSIENLVAPAGYAAAVVAEGGPFTVSRCETGQRFEAPELLPA